MLSGVGTWRSGQPADVTTKPTISFELSAKPACLASWQPRQPLDGSLTSKTASRRASWRLLTPNTPKTASGRASWRPRRPLDGPPGAQDGVWRSLLPPETASRRASDAKSAFGRDNSLDVITLLTRHLLD